MTRTETRIMIEMRKAYLRSPELPECLRADLLKACDKRLDAHFEYAKQMAEFSALLPKGRPHV